LLSLPIICEPSYNTLLSPSFLIHAKNELFRRACNDYRNGLYKNADGYSEILTSPPFFNYSEIKIIISEMNKYLNNNNNKLFEIINVNFYENKEYFFEKKLKNNINFIKDYNNCEIMTLYENEVIDKKDCSETSFYSKYSSDYSGLLVIGDIHSNLKALCHAIDLIMEMMLLPKEESKVIFLGDWIDRGYYPVLFLFKIKKKY
jgi:hypothetical protein